MCMTEMCAVCITSGQYMSSSGICSCMRYVTMCYHFTVDVRFYLYSLHCCFEREAIVIIVNRLLAGDITLGN